MVRSDNEPKTIEIDEIENGVARIYVRWNAKQVDVPAMDGQPARKEWEYEEEVIPWTLPAKYTKLADIEVYIAGKLTEIQGYAEAKQVQYSRDTGVKVAVSNIQSR